MTLALTVFVVSLISLSSILRTEAGRIGEVVPSILQAKSFLR